MRILRNAGLTMVTALAFAGAANAQRLGGNAGAGIPQQPGGGMPVMAPPMGDAPQAGAHFPAPGPMRGGGQWHGSHGGQWSGGHWSGGQRRGRPAGRWGGSIGGHWSGGANAPGGWNAYHHPQRGWALPGYWIAPSFYIDDFWSYGLSQPPEGYRWSRYYDDAVLIDDRGRVWDSMDGVDWDGADRGGHTDYIFSEHGHDGAYPPPPMVYRGPAGPNGGSYTTTTTYAGGGYAAGGYWYPPATTTTVVVQSAPIVTTTTTEYVDVVKTRTVRTWHAPVKRWHRHVRYCPPAEAPIRGS